MRLAAGAHALCQSLTLTQRQAAHQELQERIAHRAPQTLVRMIVDAERVTVHQQHAPAVEVDHCAIVQQLCARVPAEAPPDQKVAIAMEQVAGHTACRQRPQGGDDESLVGIGVVIADPGLEQIAQDVQCTRATGLLAQKAQELRGDVGSLGIQMQVGDEQCRHGLSRPEAGGGIARKRPDATLRAVCSSSWRSRPPPVPAAPRSSR